LVINEEKLSNHQMNFQNLLSVSLDGWMRLRDILDGLTIPKSSAGTVMEYQRGLP
jgi:hypothetical protein